MQFASFALAFALSIGLFVAVDAKKIQSSEAEFQLRASTGNVEDLQKDDEHFWSRILQDSLLSITPSPTPVEPGGCLVEVSTSTQSSLSFSVFNCVY